MKTISKLFILTFILLSVSSCKKINQRKPIKVNLRVENIITQAPYPNVKWIVYEYEYVKGQWGLNSKIILEGTTDQNGEAHIEFKRPMSRKLSYELRIILTDELATAQANQTSWDLQDKTEQDVKASISEKTGFVLHIKNTNCFDANDLFNIKFNNGIYTDYNYHVDDTFTGCYDNLFNQHLIEDKYPFTKTLTRNGVTTTTYDTLVISKAMEGDTINIFY